MIVLTKPYFDESEVTAISEVVRSGRVSQGKLSQMFEEKVADYCGVKYAIAVSSGTAAIHTALHVAGIGPGDEVITSPFTFIGSVNPIVSVGAIPVFADIDSKDYCIDPSQIEKHITQKTKAILAVDLFGQIYQHKAVRALARKHNLLIIEDACQSFGAMQGTRRAGSFGDIAAFSFYATKTITTAEGGMVMTNNKELYDRASEYRNHNQKSGGNYEYLGHGHNFRFTDIEAAIGLVQLGKADDILAKRRSLAQYYMEGLKDVSGILLPLVTSNNTHSYGQFCIRVTDEFATTRDVLIAHLEKAGIQTRVYYPRPLHLFPFLQKSGYQQEDCPTAEQMSRELVALPLHPSLSESEADTVISAICSVQ